MKPTEEALTPDQLRDLEATVRQALVEAHALMGLTEAGCLRPSRVLPAMLRHLRPIHTGDGAFRVLVVDDRGEVRQGPKGPMTATELASELKRDEAFQEIGWK